MKQATYSFIYEVSFLEFELSLKHVPVMPIMVTNLTWSFHRQCQSCLHCSTKHVIYTYIYIYIVSFTKYYKPVNFFYFEILMFQSSRKYKISLNFVGVYIYIVYLSNPCYFLRPSFDQICKCLERNWTVQGSSTIAGKSSYSTFSL